MGEPSGLSNIPAWMQLFIAAVTGAVLGTGGLVRWASRIDRRVAKLENHNLTDTIDRRISEDWHNNRAPMLQTRIFADLDKMTDKINDISQDVAVLMERDRQALRMEQAIAALNAQALKNQL